MWQFLQLNRSKLPFIFGVTSLVFTTLALAIFAIGFLTAEGQGPTPSLFVTVILNAAVVVPFFILMVIVIRGSWDLAKREKAFGSKPFSDLSSKGFVTKLKNDKNRWQLVEPLLKGEIRSFPILAEVDTQHAADVIRFQALVEKEVIKKGDFEKLTKKFSTEDIEFDFQGITKKISVKNYRMNTIDELMTELNRFIKLLEQEGLKPKKMKIT